MNNFLIEIETAFFKDNAKTVTETLLVALRKTNTTLPFMERTEKILPGISDMVSEQMSYEEIYTIVEDMILKRLKTDKEYIKEKTDHFYMQAQGVLSTAIEKMIEIFSVEYSVSPIFKCFLGVNNPFPRSVMNKEYFLHNDISDEMFLKASLHEINHMILFDKWKSMHGYNSNGEPEFPSVLWYLEELAIEPTLNDRCIQEIIPIRHSAYDSLKKVQIDGISLTEHIQRIYEQGKNIEVFLDTAYDFLSNNL